MTKPIEQRKLTASEIEEIKSLTNRSSILSEDLSGRERSLEIFEDDVKKKKSGRISSIKILKKDIKENNSEMKKIWKRINFLKLICEHGFDCTGYNSHKDLYECRYCGQQDWV